MSNSQTRSELSEILRQVNKNKGWYDDDNLDQNELEKQGRSKRASSVIKIQDSAKKKSEMKVQKKGYTIEESNHLQGINRIGRNQEATLRELCRYDKWRVGQLVQRLVEEKEVKEQLKSEVLRLSLNLKLQNLNARDEGKGKADQSEIPQVFVLQKTDSYKNNNRSERANYQDKSTSTQSILLENRVAKDINKEYIQCKAARISLKMEIGQSEQRMKLLQRTRKGKSSSHINQEESEDEHLNDRFQVTEVKQRMHRILGEMQKITSKQVTEVRNRQKQSLSMYAGRLENIYPPTDNGNNSLFTRLEDIQKAKIIELQPKLPFRLKDITVHEIAEIVI